MLEKSNVMLLDEPTNHLDLSSKEVLEAALKDYQGTLIFVSHDRYLLNKIPDKIVEITKNGAIIYDGKYDYYLEKKRDADIPSIEEKTTKPEKNNGGHKSKEQRRNKARQMLRIKEIEKRISELENENELLQSELLTEGVYSDYKKASEKTERLENNTLELENLYTRLLYTSQSCRERQAYYRYYSCNAIRDRTCLLYTSITGKQRIKYIIVPFFCLCKKTEMSKVYTQNRYVIFCSHRSNIKYCAISAENNHNVCFGH